MTYATEGATTSSPGGLLALVALAVVLYLGASARHRLLGRRCERYGHAPDAATLGKWDERCARCGARLR